MSSPDLSGCHAKVEGTGEQDSFGEAPLTQ
jgi:hypothetical protein